METFDAKQEKLCHKNGWQAEGGNGVGVEYITTFIFMIYDLCEFCVSSIPTTRCVRCVSTSCQLQLLLHLFLFRFSYQLCCFCFFFRCGIKCINQASSISRQLIRAEQQQISPAQITLIEANVRQLLPSCTSSFPSSLRFNAKAAERASWPKMTRIFQFKL